MQRLCLVRFATAVILSVLICLGAAVGQDGRISSGRGSYQGSGSGLPSSRSASGTGITAPRDILDEPESGQILARREAARKLERKKRMVDSANRLLALTEQLQSELKTREATPDDAKRLDEIARLARSVKDQMRN